MVRPRWKKLHKLLNSHYRKEVTDDDHSQKTCEVGDYTFVVGEGVV